MSLTCHEGGQATCAWTMGEESGRASAVREGNDAGAEITWRSDVGAVVTWRSDVGAVVTWRSDVGVW